MPRPTDEHPTHVDPQPPTAGLRRAAAIAALCLWPAIAPLSGCGSDVVAPENMLDGRILTAAEGKLSASFEMDNPRKGLNALSMWVFDAAEQPLSAAVVEVKPWMPAHGHGSVDVVAGAMPGEAGGYGAPEIYFPMTGYWELTVDVRVDGEAVDSFLVPVHVR